MDLRTLLSPSTILSVIIAVVAIVVWAFLRKLSKKRGETKNNAWEFEGIVLSVIRIIILAVAVLWIMQINGVNVSSVAAGLGIVSAIVGLALQDTLQDIIMGVKILGDSFFNVGDVVEYASRECEVVGFTLSATKLKDLIDGSLTTVSNRKLNEIKKINNILEMTVPLSYDEDTKKVHTVLGEIAEKIAKAESIDDCQYLGTLRFEDSAIIYKFKICCAPSLRPSVQMKAIRILQDGLNEAGIAVPFNQLDVHCNITERKG